jgi:hypothetical protein
VGRGPSSAPGRASSPAAGSVPIERGAISAHARIPAAFGSGGVAVHLVTAGGVVVTVGTFDFWAGQPGTTATPAG